MMAVTAWMLPVGYEPDRSVELRPLPILRNYAAVLKEPQFLTYALAGAFAFAGLLVYVASSPIVFMEVFHVSAKQFGAIFAGLSVGFIGSWFLSWATSSCRNIASLTSEVDDELLDELDEAAAAVIALIADAIGLSCGFPFSGGAALQRFHPAGTVECVLVLLAAVLLRPVLAVR